MKIKGELVVAPATKRMLTATLNALAEARTVEEVKELCVQAKVIWKLVKERDQSREALNAVAEIILRAEFKLGQFLTIMTKHDGHPRSHDVTRLADLGIGKMESSRLQTLATLGVEEFEAFLTNTKGAGKLITTAAALRFAKSRRPAKRKKFHVHDQEDRLRRLLHQRRAGWPKKWRSDFPAVLAKIARQMIEEDALAQADTCGASADEDGRTLFDGTA